MKTILTLSIVVLILLSVCLILLKNSYSLYQKHYELQEYPAGLKAQIKMDTISGEYSTVVIGDSHAENWMMQKPRFLNLGIGGQTSSQVCIRSEYYKNILKGDTLIILVGANDLKCVSVGTGIDDLMRTYFENLNAITSNLKPNFREIIISTIPPVFRVPPERAFLYGSKYNEGLKRINSEIRTYCKNNHLRLLDTYTIVSEAMGKEKISIDGIHLIPKAYELLQQNLACYSE
jgi:lysophospholipase L1-like esterase